MVISRSEESFQEVSSEILGVFTVDNLISQDSVWSCVTRAKGHTHHFSPGSGSRAGPLARPALGRVGPSFLTPHPALAGGGGVLV